MEPIILVAGSAVGAFTAVAIERVSKGNAKLLTNNPNEHSIGLEKRVVAKALNRLYDYEQKGRITGNEREMLVFKYKQELNALDKGRHTVTLYNPQEFNVLKEDLVAVVDQRMEQMNSKLDDLASKISKTTVQSKPTASVERKEEKHVEAPKPVSPVEIAESPEGIESDHSIDEIRKQIEQTLYKLEQAEVE